MDCRERMKASFLRNQLRRVSIAKEYSVEVTKNLHQEQEYGVTDEIT